MTDRTDGLIVFAKPPEPGRVKTRLTALLSPEEAAALYRAFLKDALDAYATLDVDVLLFVAAAEERLEDEVFARSHSRSRQRGQDLGERMAHAFASSFARGYRRLVIIGTDHPTLPRAFVQQAFTVLDEPATIVIGPSHDGGYYLLGMNDFYPEVWEGMSYSHERVFEQTLERITRSDAQPVVLPPWYDVDDPAALQRLAGELEASDAACPATRDQVAGLRTRYPQLRAGP